MKETDLQEKYLINFICDRPDGLNYREAKANTVSPNFFIVEDLRQFVSGTDLNKPGYRKLLKKFGNDEALFTALMAFLDDKIQSAMNMAIFINSNKSITFEGVKLYLFYPSGNVIGQDNLFEQNIFTVVQELPINIKYEGKRVFAFRPDLCFFLNGIFFSYSELKSNWNDQTARKNGRGKVKQDYRTAAESYLRLADKNDLSESIRKQVLRVFEKAILITSTDIAETYVIRNIATQLDELRQAVASGKYDYTDFDKKFEASFKTYPLRNPKAARSARFEEVFRALYDKKMIEKEILYYNFIERELVRKPGSKTKEYKHNDGRLISPRPKQKFGTDKIISKIDEFLAHEDEPDYFINKLEAELIAQGVGIAQRADLIAKRLKFQNNKVVYSLLMQYAAGFGKSNIIGWSALQLKDIQRNGQYVYDKIMLVVDRLQLRDQLDTKMHNMNIQKAMFTEATDQASFTQALSSDTRIVVVNVQKFGSVINILDKDVVKQLAKMRIAFLIDEIHRSNSGSQHEEMISVFDELQSSFDNNEAYQSTQQKKNLIVGFTATPDDNTLARFGEFSHYAENTPIWVPFDSYTMREAIEDGYILNPIKGIVPVAAKMFFEVPDNAIEGFEGDTGYGELPADVSTGVDRFGHKYAIRKKRIYSNPDRIEAIARFVVERLVASVYHNIRGSAKAMLAVASIPAAIQYKNFIDEFFAEIVKEKKYERFADAGVFIVYSDSQDYPSCRNQNGGLSEAKVLQEFQHAKNGLIIVIDKLQTGFDEPKLHTLFLDKEIRGINAIQTISRVNRTTKHKNDCKIIDFSYKNVNVKNIKVAFEHFSNVVVSDFDPLADEAVMIATHKELTTHELHKTHFAAFRDHENNQAGVQTILGMEEAFEAYINNYADAAKKLKENILNYFRILNLIEYVIQVDEKYSESVLLDFWRRYNIIYNQIHRHGDLIDDVEIYFDNRIGITAPDETPVPPKKKILGGATGGNGKEYAFDILRVIEKRNQQEEEIAALIADFEDKIKAFFAYIATDGIGKRLVAKIKDGGSAFSQDEIYSDFSKVFRLYTIKNKNLGMFFLRETKDNLNQLCDDFERSLKKEGGNG